MKRFIVALLVGGVVFSAAFAAAATLVVSGGALQMSSAVSAICDPNPGGVTLGYLFFDSDANPSTDNDIITEAQVRDIDDACVGDTITVELFADTSNNGILDVGDTKCDEAEIVIPADGSGGDQDADAGEVGVNLDLTPDDPGLPDPCNLVGPTGLIASFVNIAGPADWP